MPRPDDDRLREWALPGASTEPGPCRDAAIDLLGQVGVLGFPGRRGVRLYIDRGCAQDHWGVALLWEGEDAETIVDNTIGQFGGGSRVFVGSQKQWFDALRELMPGATVKVDDTRGTHFNAAVDREMWAEQQNARRRSVDGSAQAPMAQTLSGKQRGRPRHHGCCVIL